MCNKELLGDGGEALDATPESLTETKEKKKKKKDKVSTNDESLNVEDSTTMQVNSLQLSFCVT